MAASATSVDDRLTRKIHTAACLIIGDEVLGGKVCSRGRSRSSGVAVFALTMIRRRLMLVSSLSDNRPHMAKTSLC